ncbi:DNA-binding transcription factor yap1 [Podila epicladia]|nr:DNA-binding transcription factor yap1 [Podila epicladia]
MALQTNDIYSVALADNEWSQILSENSEAQDLLSNAIAHHEQYREDPKRTTVSHLHHKSDNYAKPTNGGNYDDPVQYSEGDNSSDEGTAPGDGKPAPKKAGRKPLTTEPTNKRKAQNRAAQRAFRERKERYVKSLEDRIKELEELNPGRSDSKLAEENMNLKVLVQKLETENYFLKEQSFTFDFPISQPGLYGMAKAQAQAQTTQGTHLKSPSPEQSSPNTTSAQVPEKPKTAKATTVAQKNVPAYEHLPWTPPSSGGDSVPISPLDHDLPTPEQEVLNHVSFSDNAGVVPRIRNSTPEEIALFSSILDGTGNTFTNHTHHSVSSLLTHTPTSHKLDTPSPSSTMALFSDNSPSPTLEELVNTPLFETDKHGNVQFTPPVTNMTMPTLTYEQTQALFTDFRDPSAPGDFFSSFDDPVEPKFPGDTIGGLFNDQLLDYTFNNVTSPPTREGLQSDFFSHVPSSAGASPAASGSVEHKHSLPPLGENEKAIPCPQVWEHIAKHPNFDDADIDDLCAELKSKAKCSGHGPVIALSDVDKLMNRLNQE